MFLRRGDRNKVMAVNMINNVQKMEFIDNQKRFDVPELRNRNQHLSINRNQHKSYSRRFQTNDYGGSVKHNYPSNLTQSDHQQVPEDLSMRDSQTNYQAP